MGDAVDSEPVLQEPRMYASYFFNRLKECSLIEWTELLGHHRARQGRRRLS